MPVTAGDDADPSLGHPLKCCHIQFNSFDVHRVGEAGRDDEGVAGVFMIKSLKSGSRCGVGGRPG